MNQLYAVVNNVDKTAIKVHGKWCYLYRAIDADGNLVDSRLSEKRDMEATQRFFKQALSVVGHAPEHPRAVHEILGSDVQHRTNTYLNNRLEQDHRGVKQRYDPMRGCGNFASAARFCHAFDELHNYFRPRHTMGEAPSLLEQRRLFCEKLAALQCWMRMAS
jgi:putative transposase